VVTRGGDGIRNLTRGEAEAIAQRVQVIGFQREAVLGQGGAPRGAPLKNVGIRTTPG